MNYKNFWERINAPSPIIMGVLNLTPDSFSDGGQYVSSEKAHLHIEQLIADGAEIIDIGAESTRPGAEPVSATAQIKRLAPVLSNFTRRYCTALSVDTTSAEVAEYSLANGASIINDISALRFEPELAGVVAKYGATLILNHSRQTPQTMQDAPSYTDVCGEVMTELSESIRIAQRYGVTQFIIDPGIGFGKQVTDNLELLNQIKEFHQLGYPLMVGTSRKSFIGHITGEPIGPRLSGTIASTLWAIHHGVKVVRVHDVGEVAKAIKVWREISDSVKST